MTRLLLALLGALPCALLSVSLSVLLWAQPAGAKPCVDTWAEPEAFAPGDDYAALRQSHPRAPCTKRWTALLYLAGDAQDLVAPMQANLAALQTAGGSTADLDVVVLHDDLGPSGLKRLHIYAGGAAEIGGDPSFTDETRPPEEILRRFLAWGVTEYPAEHTLVVLAGHGLGWRPTLPTAPAEAQQFDLKSKWGGFGFDASNGTVLDTPALRRALEAVVEGPRQGRPFDVVLSDACLMQSLEVATELADTTRYLGGSAQVQPYVGLPYASLLRRLRRPPTDPVDGCADGDGPCRVARQTATLHQQALERSASVEAVVKAQHTYAVLDTAQLRLRLLPALATFADALADLIERHPETSIDVGVVLGETPGFLGGTRDLGAFLNRIEQIHTALRGGAFATVNTAARDARLALDTTVLNHALGSTYRSEDRYAGMKGLAVWLPMDEPDSQRRLDFFLQSRLHRTLGPAPGQTRGRWQRLLDLTFRPPVPAECGICPTQ